MANSSAKSAVFFYLILMLSLLLVASTVESSRSLLDSPEGKTPECDAVYGAVEGDSCFAVTQMFNLTTEFFNSINPNLDCDKIFIGQWLCVDGSA